LEGTDAISTTGWYCADAGVFEEKVKKQPVLCDADSQAASHFDIQPSGFTHPREKPDV